MSTLRTTQPFGHLLLRRELPPELAPVTPGPDGPPTALVLVHPASAGTATRHPIGARVTVGRDPGCEVVAADPSVSRRHARVERAPGGGHVVTDLGSTNGTFVNGVRVLAAYLQDGDELWVGHVRFRFRAGPADGGPTGPAGVAALLGAGEGEAVDAW